MTAQSKTPTPTTSYLEVVRVIERYVSPLLARSVLQNTLDRERIDPSRVTAVTIDHFVERAMIGLRLFCEPMRLPDMMIELAEICLRHRNDSPSRIKVPSRL